MTCKNTSCEREKTVRAGGQACCTWCESWRLACEARYIARLPSITARRAYLADILKRRGARAQSEMMSLVRAEFEKLKQEGISGESRTVRDGNRA